MSTAATPSNRAPLTHLSDDEVLFRDAVASFAAEAVLPRVREMEAAGRIDPSIIAQYFEMGLMGIEVPESLGGAGGSAMMIALAVEELSKVDPAAAIVVDVQNTLVNYPIHAYGTADQHARYLTRLTSDTIGAYALSEAGSVLARWVFSCH
jgi:alkylation response protein AidB-like acyl-CoA dehydrogenase